MRKQKYAQARKLNSSEPEIPFLSTARFNIFVTCFIVFSANQVKPSKRTWHLER